MTVLENIELCDNGYVEVKEINVAQKIKLRTPSHQAISAKYSEFSRKGTESMPSTPTVTQNSSTQVPQTTVEIASVVALNPRIAEMIQLLEMSGRIKSEAYKALKIKPTMQDNMLKNTAIKKADDNIEEMSTENAEALAQVGTEQELELVVNDEEQRVSKNGATAAKIEKFTTKIEVPEETVSPVIVEEATARPVSREIPLVAPERVANNTTEKVLTKEAEDEEEKQEEPKVTIKTETAASEDTVTASLPDNITDLAAIRDYLEKTAILKREAEQAKDKEEAAKKSAEKAEQEAANRRDEFVKTAERIAAHQESLIAQTEKSKEQANIYEAKRGEYENETAEYQKAINDMLAIMGVSEQDDKGKIM